LFRDRFGNYEHFVKEYIHDSRRYESIRVCEPDSVTYSPLPLVQLVKPSVLSRIRENRSVKTSEIGTLSKFFFVPKHIENEAVNRLELL
jgi:hypothetical protein